MKTQNKQLVKALRHHATDAEKKLWRHVRNRQLAGMKFRRQQSSGPYILDFYCAEMKLAIELDGGKHGSPVGIERDQRRDEFFRHEGMTVLRFWNNQVMQEFDGVLETIHRALAVGPLTRTLSPDGEREAHLRLPSNPDSIMTGPKF